MSKISSIIIRRFKRIENIEIPLENVTVIVGANNSGKSSILQAIHLAVSISQTSKLIGGVNWQQGNYELSINPTQLLYSPVSDVLALATGGQLQEPRPSQIEIVFNRDDGETCLVALRRGRNRNIAISIQGRTLGEELQNLERPFSIYAPGLAGIPREEQYFSPGYVRRIVARGDANLVLRNVLLQLKSNEQSNAKFISWLQIVFPDINLDIQFDHNTDEYIRALVVHEDGPSLPIDSEGTSILQTCQLLAYIALYNPKILILDEPDSHLHPDNQRKLISSINDIAHEENIQVLISTHSRHVLDAARKNASTIWISKGNIAQQTDPSTLAILLDIGALDSVDFFADGAARCVFITEDTKTQGLSTLLWASGFHEAETYVRSYSGASNLLSANVLGSFLKEKAPNVSTIVHRDRDYLSEDEITLYRRSMQETGVFPFITMQNEIESYFINSDHLAYLNPNIARERIEQLIDQSVAEVKDITIRSMINSRTEYAFKKRREGVPQINHGAIAIEATRDYETNPRMFSKGKELLSRLVGHIQDEIGSRPIIYQTSPFINVPELNEISRTIWHE